ncbi:hypothetical protein BKA93DRAFT_932085 [Sparassis latifolia]
MSFAHSLSVHDDLYDPWREDSFTHLLPKPSYDWLDQEEPSPFAKATASKTNRTTSLPFEPSDHIASLLRRVHPNLVHAINPWCGLRGSRDTDEYSSLEGEPWAETARGWDEGSLLEQGPADDFTTFGLDFTSVEHDEQTSVDTLGSASPEVNPPQAALAAPADHARDGSSCSCPRQQLSQVESTKQMPQSATPSSATSVAVNCSSVEALLAAPLDNAREGPSSSRPQSPPRVENAQLIPPRRTPRSPSQRTAEPSAQRSATRSVLVAPADRAPVGPSSSSPPSQGKKRKQTEEIVEVEKRETKKRRTQNEGVQGEEEPKRTTNQGNQIAEDEVDLGVHGIINRGGKKLECTYCDKFFANGAHAIVRHVQSNRHLEKLPHEIREELSKAAKLHCEHCNKEISGGRRDSLRRHYDSCTVLHPEKCGKRLRR